MGERYLGRISSVAGASTNNLTTATPFAILPGSKITVVASAAGRVAADFETCVASPAANFGIPVSAGGVFPTSVGRGTAAMANSPGTTTAVVSFLPTSGAADLDVWVRGGQE